MFRYTLLRTVLDPLLAVTGPAGLVRLEFLPRAYQYHTRAHAVARALLPPDTEPVLTEESSSFAPLREQLAAYFTGSRESFDLDLELHGTQFQQRVWRELTGIPYGKLRTYGEIARVLGDVRATRAVGQAAGRNPLPILVPCHRVVGRDGSLVGFAGGISTKARLLRLEGHTLGDEARLEEPQLF